MIFEKFINQNLPMQDLQEYQKDKQEIKSQLVPPICTKIQTETIIKLEKWRARLEGGGLKKEAKEAHELAIAGCAAYWINKLENFGPSFDGEEVLSDILEEGEMVEKAKRKRLAQEKKWQKEEQEMLAKEKDEK